MVKHQISKVYSRKQISEKDCSNCEIIRELNRYYLKQTRKAFKEHPTYKECEEIWNEEHNAPDFDRWTSRTTEFWFDKLGELFKINCDIAKWLMREITYLKHIEELKQAFADYKPLVEDVINSQCLYGCIYDPSETFYGYRKDYDGEEVGYRFGLTEEEARSYGEDEQTDMDFLIAHSKKLVNILCRICKENKTGHVYDVY